MILNNSSWEDKNTYWLSKNKQGTDEWINERLCSLTQSKISSYANRSLYQNSPEEDAEIICGISKKSFTSTQQNSMEIGMYGEQFLRNWYQNELSKKYNKKIIVNEVGLGIWKKDPRFRGSLDGDIDEDLCVEFKIPKYMPKQLIDHFNSNNIKPNNYDHIKPDNYDQMQGNMVIHNKKFCDYVVYSYKDKLLYYERIPVNYDHFYNVLYPKAIEFYDKYVVPLMEKLNLKRIDP